MQVLNITRWPFLLLFVGAGFAVVVFAFMTVNLFSLAMANFSLIRAHGWVALQEGALAQLAELCFGGAVALSSWLAFKIFEAEITQRYRRWAEQARPPEAGSETDPPAE